MGWLEEMVIMGPYGEIVIATRDDEAEVEINDRGWHIYGQLVMLLYCFIGFFSGVTVIVYLTWNHIGLIIGVAIIGLGFWTCQHYGTNNSLFDRFRYRRLSPDERARIGRRLKGE